MTNDISKKKGKSSGDKKAKRKAKRRETYAMYIYKVLKQVGGEKKCNVLHFFFFLFALNVTISYFRLHSQGSSGYGDFKQSHEHHELFRERPVRADCHGSVPAGSVQ